MSRQNTDLSRVPISVAPSPATSGTSLGTTDANAAYLPDTYPYWAVLCPTGQAPTRANSEIVKVTAGSSSGGTTTLTIVRTQGIPVTTAQTVTTSFDIYDANSAEAQIGMSLISNEVPSGTKDSSNTTFTLASIPATGTLKLYVNGVRQTITTDYSLSGLTITMVVSPVSTDLLLADYSLSTGVMTTGSTSFINSEVANETPNGVVTAFTVDFPYVAGSTMVHKMGVRMLPGAGNDYTETTPASGTITFTTAPATGSIILVDYQKSLSVSGNADTLDGYHANATPTANNIPVLDANKNHIVATGTGIADDVGNEELLFTKVTSAVNEVTITNAATTTAPKIEATGGDTNTHLFINGKGTGRVVAQIPIYYQKILANYTSTTNSNEQVVGTGGTPLIITLPIIKKTCLIKISICFFSSFATGDTNVAGTIGVNSNGIGNTGVANIYQGGTSSSNASYFGAGIASVDLSTQQYVAMTVRNYSNQAVTFSASDFRTSLIVEIYG